MVVWLVFWAAGMILAVVALGSAALRGEVGAILFLVLWLGGAGLGLYNGARRLRGLLMGETKPRRVGQPRNWNDGISKGSGEP